MKSQHSLSLSLAFALVSSLTSVAQPPPIRIMPLGDDLTYGQGVPGGYRHPLYVALTNVGYTVDYVGTRTDNAVTGLPDSNHQGLNGWRISGGSTGLDENLYQWLNVIDDPDVVLLHIGANDTNSTANAITRLDALISRIATNRPCANIIVTTLLPRGDAYSNYVTEVFNPNIEATVSAQQALGRKVSYLDLYSCLTIDDLTGTPALYPSDTGYAKMAAAWYTAVTNLVTPYGDTNAPSISRAIGVTNLSQVVVTFTKAINPATATNLSNYAIDGGLAVTAASLSADQRKVTLTTAPQTKETLYTITVNNLADVTPSPGPLTIAADTTVSFKAVCRGYLANVPESADYVLAYSMDLPNNAKYGRGAVPYTTDNSVPLNGPPLSRIAYYVELQCPNTPLTYLWVSMDAFTNDTSKIGVPTLATGVVLQNYLTGLNIQCNDPALSTGTGLLGNIEFWPSNYSAPNSASIPDASGSLYDWGDQPTTGTYGCMQLHNYVAKQTLFTFSNWGTESINGATPDIGIGNCPSPKSGGVDWTFSNDAGMYAIKTLQIFVKRSASADTVPPTITSAQAGFAGNLIQVAFSESLAPDSICCGNFTFDNGVDVVSASLLPDLCTVNLLTTPQPAGTALTLFITGVRDGTGGNPVAPGTSVAVTAPDVLPSELVTNAGALADGYRLVYTLDLPTWSDISSSSNPYRFNQANATCSFDRVAYYLELQKGPSSAIQYLWASMDAFTPYLSKIGVPTLASKAVFQQPVDNLDVKSNVAGISNGTGLSGGYLEFWPTDYGASNAMGVAGASNGNYDFGDERRTTGTHGSMQVHNVSAAQTLFGLNNWGGNNTAIALGIGDCPTSLRVNSGVDWTFAENAGSYSRRRLYVLVRPCAASFDGIPDHVAANVPGSAGYKHLYTIDIPVQASFNTNSPAYYSVNNYAADMGSFGRVAYYLELQSDGNPTQWIWTAMNAFTTDARRLGVPTNTCYFQQPVRELEVLSNVGGIVTGSSIDTGNIEFWPSSYNATNPHNVPGASAANYDWGDGNASGSSTGYGSMQVHNHGASATQTLFAVNNFNNNAASVCIGIGNRPGQANSDWTFANNAGSYNHRRLYVFVQPGGDPFADLTRPTLVRALGSAARDLVTLFFSETVSDSAAELSNFALNNGVSVLSAALMPEKNAVQLVTTPLTADQSYTVTVSGVTDRSASANPIITGSTISFVATAPATVLPAVLSGVPEAESYTLIHSLAIGNSTSYANGAPYTIDESLYQTQTFDRIAYCLELTGTNGIAKWAYVSMDAFTHDLFRVGLPTADRNAVYQQYVTNLNVYASSSDGNVSITTGVGIASGNIEFWASNYGQGNSRNIPGASSTLYDFGDDRGSNTGAGHGTMQVHNFAEGHTIFAINSFGSNGRTPCLGIGNNPVWSSNDPDWTHTYNAPTYSVKNLHVLVRWGEPNATALSGTVPAILSQPRSATTREQEAFYFSVQAMGATRYQWRHNGVWIPGANLSYLSSPSAAVAQEGTYDVLIFGSGSAYATSASATLDVITLGTLLKLR